MVKKKRWGEKYKDKRSWKEYNQKLIKRGEFYMNPRFLDDWKKEIKEMNCNKLGQPYTYPNSLIQFLAMLFPFFSLRSLEGIISGLNKRLGPFPVISFSQIRRRIEKLDFNIHPKNHNMVVASDGSGIKLSNRGEWMREKWAIRRGWIKVVILGDIDGNIIDIIIGDENLNENTSARKMIKKNKAKINKFFGDGLYDTKENFRLLDRLGIMPVIKIRENACAKAKGCMARKKQVTNYKQKGYKEWAKENKYGKRWVATEGIFSATKRIFGESVRSHKIENAYQEAKLKFWAYQKIKDCI